ncbi:MAG: hypothetical protein Q9174_002959 [Haloplaca sp. 1 TL-2023]
MGASPASSTSSDLYGPPEPTMKHDYVQSGSNGEIRSGQMFARRYGNPSPEARLPVNYEAVAGAGNHVAQNGVEHGHPTDIPTSSYSKRKREDEPQVSYNNLKLGESLSKPESMESIHNGPTMVGMDDRLSSRAPSGSKRIKTGDFLSEKVGSADAQSGPAGLPAELWHRIFRYVPPVFLGRLLRVNRAFHSYLTNTHVEDKPGVSPNLGRGAVRPLAADTIWLASRKRFAPGLPKPFRGSRELDMWRLLRGRNCQLCGTAKEPSHVSKNENPWQSGPGEQSEVDLLLSTSCPSFLLPALPPAFINNTLNYVPISLLRESTSRPPSMRIDKRFYKPHVEKIKKELDAVRELGTASADEWSKGLADEGKERISDAMRWEQWEAKGGLKKVNARPQPKPTVAPAVKSVPSSLPKRPNAPDWEGLERQNAHMTMMPTYSGPYANGSAMAPELHQYPPSAARESIPINPNRSEICLHSINKAPYAIPWINTGPFQESPSYRHPPSVPMTKPERSIKDANEGKAARRAEIERRCSLLDQPIPANILNHMESFQAAIQISTPFTDIAWDLLKPRLLSQRANAEKREQEQVRQNEILQSELQQRRHQESQKQTKELLDRQWESAQASIRDRLGVLADEYINERWSGGGAVFKESSPLFAADVLLTARRRFYETAMRERENTGQANDDEGPNGSQQPTLTLENMKWLFDAKVKPITERFQKELFLCNGCDDNFKMYGFEGVIQHYAAKHTTSLSMGSIVVYWRSEWPDEPPFNPEPSVSKSGYYKVPSPATGGSNTYAHLDQSLYGSSGAYGAAAESGSTPSSNMYAAPQPTASYYSTQVPPEQTSSYPASYGQAYPSAPTSTVTPSGVDNSYTHTSSNNYPPHWQGAQAPVPPIQGAGGQDYSPLYPGGQSQFQSTFIPNGTSSNVPYGSHVPHPAAAPQPLHFESSRNNAGQRTQEYQEQMDEMAKQAREVWFSTASIKDIPASVRIYVVIHHMAARFSEKFSTVPSLAMFLDGIDNNSQMRPVRSLNGLACKVCVTQQNGLSASEYQIQAHTGERRLYTLPHLLNHFRTAHLEDSKAFENPHEGPDGPKNDWTRDMIELPETRLIADLVHSSGMDDNKLELIAWAFPRVFPSPLPKLGPLRSSGPFPKTGEALDLSNAFPSAAAVFDRGSRSALSNGRGEGQLLHQASGALRSSSRHSRPSEPPGDDEYDPHKPAYLDRHGVNGTGYERVRGSTGYPSDQGGERWTGYEAQRERQLPDAADLSKLLYNATHPQPAHEMEKASEHHQEPERFQPTGLRPLVASSFEEHGYRKAAEDDGYRNGPIRGHASAADQVPAPLSFDGHNTSASAGVQAAEQFLRRFGQTTPLEARNSPNGFEYRRQPSPTDPWPDTRESVGRVHTNPSRQGGIYRPAPALSDTSPITPARVSRLDFRNDHSRSPIQSHFPEMHHAPEYQRPASRTFLQPYESEMAEGRQHTYVSHDTPHRTMVYSSNQHNNERFRSNQDVVRVPPSYHYRDQARSPEPVAMDPRYYHHDSRNDNTQRQTVYHVRSPVSPPQPRLQRSFHERPTHEQYDPAEMPGYYPENQNGYRQRVEYVPVRMGDASPPASGRYYVAQPPEARGRAEYVRVDDRYEQGAVFERDGRLYRAEPRPYQTAAGSNVNYPY